jgi:hypothetical protein
MSKPSPYTKRWWTLELKEKRTEVRKLARKVYKMVKHHQFDQPIHEEHRVARNEYTTMIRKAKLEHWISWLEEADESSIWTIHRFISAPSGDGSKTRIPTLKVKQPDGTFKDVKDNKDKAKVLYDTFFFPPPEDDGINPNHVYPEPCAPFRNVTDEQIKRAFKRLQPYKGTGPDKHSNSILKNCCDLLVPYIGPLYRATFDLEHYPEAWQTSLTAVLRKPGKPDYSIPKAHRPITLLNTWVNRFHHVYPKLSRTSQKQTTSSQPTLFGARPGKSTGDSLMLAVHWAFNKWRKGLAVSGLFLDISGAFPHTVVTRLVHNMRQRRIPKEYTDWITRRMTGRKTILTFDDFQSEPFEVKGGIDQGDPLSSACYNFYSADLIEPSNDPDELKSAFVDDIFFMVASPTFEENNRKLENMITRPGGAIEWSTSHKSNFEIDKFGLLHMSRKTEPDPTRPGKRRPLTRPSLQLAEHTIKPSASHKFLGVYLDQALNFKEHANYALGKGERYAAQVRRLIQGRKGVPSYIAAKLYQSVTLKKTLYAAEIWCSPILDPLPGKKRNEDPQALPQNLPAFNVHLRYSSREQCAQLQRSPSTHTPTSSQCTLK